MRAHKIIEFLKTRDPLDENGQAFLDHLGWAIEKSQKFFFLVDSLPDFGKEIPWQNLPYPLVYFECESEWKGKPAIMVYVALQEAKDEEITIYTLGTVPKDIRNIHPQNIIVKTRWDTEKEKYILSVGYVTEEAWTVSDDELMQEGHRHVAHVLFLCQLINCTNVELKTNLPPAALNKKRIKKGKLPLYEFKTLQIKSDATSQHSYKLEGDRNCPRLHLRRGHIRRHPTAGDIWVRSCVVGKSEQGVIEKQYEIRA